MFESIKDGIGSVLDTGAMIGDVMFTTTIGSIGSGYSSSKKKSKDDDDDIDPDEKAKKEAKKQAKAIINSNPELLIRSTGGEKIVQFTDILFNADSKYVADQSTIFNIVSNEKAIKKAGLKDEVDSWLRENFLRKKKSVSLLPVKNNKGDKKSDEVDQTIKNIGLQILNEAKKAGVQITPEKEKAMWDVMSHMKNEMIGVVSQVNTIMGNPDLMKIKEDKPAETPAAAEAKASEETKVTTEVAEEPKAAAAMSISPVPGTNMDIIKQGVDLSPEAVSRDFQILSNIIAQSMVQGAAQMSPVVSVNKDQIPTSWPATNQPVVNNAPAISTAVVNGFDNSALIATYPWIKDIQDMANKIGMHIYADELVFADEKAKGIVRISTYSDANQNPIINKSFIVDTGKVIDNRPKVCLDVMGPVEGHQLYSLFFKDKESKEKKVSEKLINKILTGGKEPTEKSAKGLYTQEEVLLNGFVNMITTPKGIGNDNDKRKACKALVQSFFEKNELVRQLCSSCMTRFRFDCKEVSDESFKLVNDAPVQYGLVKPENIAPHSIVCSKDNNGNVTIVVSSSSSSVTYEVTKNDKGEYGFNSIAGSNVTAPAAPAEQTAPTEETTGIHFEMIPESDSNSGTEQTNA